MARIRRKLMRAIVDRHIVQTRCKQLRQPRCFNREFASFSTMRSTDYSW